MPKKDKNKPKGPMSSYAAFIQVCREEHKKKHPSDTIQFAEFSKKCADRWKKMTPDDKKRFEEIAAKDKSRYNREMARYVPPADAAKGGKRATKRTKDPNAPKRNLSAFFFFCNEHRAKIKTANPSYTIGDVAKDLGKMWEKETNRPKYEALAAKDKKRYQAAMEAYNSGASGEGSRAKGASPVKKAKKVEPEPESEEEEEESEEESGEEESD